MTHEEYVPTKWDTAQQKAKFAATFKRFVRSGFKRTIFYKWFYNRLSMCFMFIAHYNIHGFYATYFEDRQGKIDFIRQVRRFPCYGDPAYTYSDVEKALQAWIDGNIAWIAGTIGCTIAELEV